MLHPGPKTQPQFDLHKCVLQNITFFSVWGEEIRGEERRSKCVHHNSASLNLLVVLENECPERHLKWAMIGSLHSSLPQ